jgi:hypothetical protein
MKRSSTTSLASAQPRRSSNREAHPADVRRAVELRAQAMALSDTGPPRDAALDDSTLAQELALVASFAARRDASDRGALAHGVRPTPGKSLRLSTDLPAGSYATRAASVSLVSTRPWRLTCQRPSHRCVRIPFSGSSRAGRPASPGRGRRLHQPISHRWTWLIRNPILLRQQRRIAEASG